MQSSVNKDRQFEIDALMRARSPCDPWYDSYSHGLPVGENSVMLGSLYYYKYR